MEIWKSRVYFRTSSRKICVDFKGKRRKLTGKNEEANENKKQERLRLEEVDIFAENVVQDLTIEVEV